MMKAPKIIYGGAGTTSAYGYNTHADVDALVADLLEQGISEIDTGAIYGDSESKLGNSSAGEHMKISTKAPGGLGPVPSTRENVIKSCEESLKLLRLMQMDIYYIHAPDNRVPIVETLSAIDELYAKGYFKCFGLSNFIVQQVDEVVSVAKDNGYVLSTVYQGNYLVVARRAYRELLPTLRRHGISFYAYSPIAGGFLAKRPEQVLGNTGRFHESSPASDIYRKLYVKPELLKALAVWNATAEAEGIVPAELAYRWVYHHSMLDAKFGDGIVIGARKQSWVKEIVGFLNNGPLSKEAVAKIDVMWETIKEVAPLDNWNDVIAKGI